MERLRSPGPYNSILVRVKLYKPAVNGIQRDGNFF